MRKYNPPKRKSYDSSCFLERTDCPSCFSTKRTLLSANTIYRFGEDFPSARFNFDIKIFSNRKLYECNYCGLWYFSLIPDEKTISDLLTGPDFPERWKIEDRFAFGQAKIIINQYFPEGGSILDVGGHMGGFISLFGNKWKKTLLEPMANSLEQPESTTIINEFIEEAKLPLLTYDCVTAFDVFEHLNQPSRAVKNIFDSIKLGGILILETGTSDSFFAKFYRSGWYYLNYLEHFQAFSKKSITNLLEMNGFKIEYCEIKRHDPFVLKYFIIEFFENIVYSILIIGRKPGLWLFLSKLLLNGHNATPPRSITLAPDHMFVVAKKIS